MKPRPLLHIKNLSLARGGQWVVAGVSFAINHGDFISLIGPNGAGKTTLVQWLVSAISHHGRRHWLGNHLDKKTTKGKIVFAKGDDIILGYLPQQQKTQKNFPATSAEVVLLGLLTARRGFRFITATDRQKIDATLRMLGIESLKNKHFHSLSGGQKQLVLLARALVAGGNFLVFDEPTTALDPAARDHFMKLLGHLNQRHGTTVIFITHDLNDTKPYANKILYLDRRVKFFGPPATFATAKNLKSANNESIACHDHT